MVAPSGMDVQIADISDFPLYNADERLGGGFPEPVLRVRRQLREADGILIASPEYNHSLTGVLKNAVDWLSIGVDSPMSRKPTAIMGAGGRLGTAKSQSALRTILAHKDVHVVNRPEVLIAGASNLFDDELNLVDERSSDQVRRLMFALDGQIRLDKSRARALVLGSDGFAAPLTSLLYEAGYRVTVSDDTSWAVAETKAATFSLIAADPDLVDSELLSVATDSQTAVLTLDGSANPLDLLNEIRPQFLN